MKKKIFILAVIALCLSIIASGTLAYFTAQEQTHNIITTDAVNIALEDSQSTDPVYIMPGLSVEKTVTVRNLDAKAYVRIKIGFVIKDADGNDMQLSPETLNSIISVDLKTEDWIRKNGDDEWFYYADAVDSENSTKPLLVDVVFDGPNMTNEYQNCTVEVTVVAQAVQHTNNKSDATEALGWPNN